MKLFIFSIFFSQLLVAQSYKKIHGQAILIDSHNDILTKTVDVGYPIDANLTGKTQSDLERWKIGGLDAQLFSVFCDGNKINPFLYANQQIDSLDAVVRRNPSKMVKVANTRELLNVVKQHKIAAMVGIEGGHMIENDLNKIDTFYQRGARYMTLTWNNSTTWATSAYSETYDKNLTKKGLSDFGKQVVQHMNTLGMLVDVSHVGEQTFWDVIQTTTKPIFASHSAVYAICPHQRNLNDEQIKAIAKNGGVIQVNFFPGFLNKNFMHNRELFLEKNSLELDSLIAIGMPEDQREYYIFNKYNIEVDGFRATFSEVMEHIEYIIKLVGVDYVGIGSDFDGIECTPEGLEDVTKYPLITQELLAKGYTKKELNKILGGNFLRVLKANETK